MLTVRSINTVRSREVSCESEKAFILSSTPEDIVTLCKDPLRFYQPSLGALQVFETGSKDMKVGQCFCWVYLICPN